MSRRMLLSVAIVALLCSLGWWMWTTRRAPAEPAAPGTASAALQPRLAVRAHVEPSAPGDDAVLEVRVADIAAAERAAFLQAERATGRRYRSEGRDRLDKTPAAEIAADWPQQLVVLAKTSAGETRLSTSVAARPEPHTVLLLMAGSTVPPPGSTVRVQLPFNGGTVTSNVVTLKAPAEGSARVIAQGRVAEQLKRGDGMAAASRALLAGDARSAWGHYFNGAALELSGDKAGAVAAYRRALEFSPRSYEPPIALLERIARLSAK